MDAMKRRMLAGEWYLDDTPGLESDRMRCQELVAQYNATAPAAAGERRRLLGELLGGLGEDVDIRPPVFFDYGHQTTVGDRTFINAGVTILDVGRVTIGAEVQIGPGVQLLTPTHPLDPARRRAGWEAQKPIVIEDGVWLGGGVIVFGKLLRGPDGTAAELGHLVVQRDGRKSTSPARGASSSSRLILATCGRTKPSPPARP